MTYDEIRALALQLASKDSCIGSPIRDVTQRAESYFAFLQSAPNPGEMPISQKQLGAAALAIGKLGRLQFMLPQDIAEAALKAAFSA